MPRYLVERTFTDTFDILISSDGARACQTIVATNMEDGVTWLHSYVSADKRKVFCIVDGPSPEAIRRAVLPTHIPTWQTSTG